MNHSLWSSISHWVSETKKELHEGWITMWCLHRNHPRIKKAFVIFWSFFASAQFFHWICLCISWKWLMENFGQDCMICIHRKTDFGHLKKSNQEEQFWIEFLLLFSLILTQKYLLEVQINQVWWNFQRKLLRNFCRTSR